jgi:hypothetical protein
VVASGTAREEAPSVVSSRARSLRRLRSAPSPSVVTRRVVTRSAMTPCFASCSPASRPSRAAASPPRSMVAEGGPHRRPPRPVRPLLHRPPATTPLRSTSRSACRTKTSSMRLTSICPRSGLSCCLPPSSPLIRSRLPLRSMSSSALVAAIDTWPTSLINLRRRARRLSALCRRGPGCRCRGRAGARLHPRALLSALFQDHGPARRHHPRGRSHRS